MIRAWRQAGEQSISFAIPLILWRHVKNARATNYLWFIEQRLGLIFGKATLAEEIAEWNVKAWPSFGAGALAAIIAAAVLAVLATVVVNNLISGTRSLEYWGKAIHWRAALRLGWGPGMNILRVWLETCQATGNSGTAFLPRRLSSRYQIAPMPPTIDWTPIGQRSSKPI